MVYKSIGEKRIKTFLYTALETGFIVHALRG